MDSLDKMVSDIEEAQLNIDVMGSLDTGNQCLKSLHQLMSVEDVEKIMDDTRESVEYQHEIDALLSGVLTAQDEADVAKELEDLLQEDMPALPDAPKDALPAPARIKARSEGQRQKEALPAS